jgi:hypothetical protein
VVQSALIFWFDLLLEARAEILEKNSIFFGDLKTLKGHSKINWPLAARSLKTICNLPPFVLAGLTGDIEEALWSVIFLLILLHSASRLFKELKETAILLFVE